MSKLKTGTSRNLNKAREIINVLQKELQCEKPIITAGFIISIMTAVEYIIKYLEEQNVHKTVSPKAKDQSQAD